MSEPRVSEALERTENPVALKEVQHLIDGEIERVLDVASL